MSTRVTTLLALLVAMGASFGGLPLAAAQPALVDPATLPRSPNPDPLVPTPEQLAIDRATRARVAAAQRNTVRGDANGDAAAATPGVTIVRSGGASSGGHWSEHGDRVDSHGPGMAILFWIFALATIGGALFVITRRNLITAVMGMVGSFLGIAAAYMMLYTNFLAVVQLLVYAGAIMVLFVFVIMILNRPEDEPVAPSGRAGQVVGGLAIAYLIGRLVMMLMSIEAPAGASAVPAAIQHAGEKYDWGSVKAVGLDLFGNGLFPFEAISILLLVAVVGAIAVARPLHEDAEDHDPNAARSTVDPDAVAVAQANDVDRAVQRGAH